VTSIRKCGPDHGVTNRLGEAPQAPFSANNYQPAIARYLTRPLKFSLHFGKIGGSARSQEVQVPLDQQDNLCQMPNSLIVGVK
jgi:hypothetical protein